jgi:hypothetical protein
MTPSQGARRAVASTAFAGTKPGVAFRSAAARPAELIVGSGILRTGLARGAGLTVWWSSGDRCPSLVQIDDRVGAPDAARAAGPAGFCATTGIAEAPARRAAEPSRLRIPSRLVASVVTCS